jgi:hypothetical protein
MKRQPTLTMKRWCTLRWPYSHDLKGGNRVKLGNYVNLLNALTIVSLITLFLLPVVLLACAGVDGGKATYNRDADAGLDKGEAADNRDTFVSAYKRLKAKADQGDAP